jgi:hypothetical protein
MEYLNATILGLFEYWVHYLKASYILLACHTPYIKDRVEFRELEEGAQEGAVKAREKEQEGLL